MNNRTMTKLAAGEPALGTLSMLTDPTAIEALGHSGLDFAIFDMEHTATDLSIVINLIRGAEITGLTPMVRVPSTEPKLIQRALDSGAQGIVAPTVRSGEEARLLASSCAYPGEGTRGTCRYSRITGSGMWATDWESFRSTANSSIISMALVEDKEGAAALEEIVAAVDVVLVGRGDLSAALGVPGEVNHPSVTAVVDRYEEIARRLEKPLATMCYTDDEAKRAVERGYTFLMYSADAHVLYRHYASFCTAMATPAAVPVN